MDGHVRLTFLFLQLTQDRQSETGWLWSRLPLTPSNYQIDIEFKVWDLHSFDVNTRPRLLTERQSHEQISGGSGHLFGDGMAIWLTKSRAEYGPVFGSKGRSCLIYLAILGKGSFEMVLTRLQSSRQLRRRRHLPGHLRQRSAFVLLPPYYGYDR